MSLEGESQHPHPQLHTGVWPFFVCLFYLFSPVCLFEGMLSAEWSTSAKKVSGRLVQRHAKSFVFGELLEVIF